MTDLLFSTPWWLPTIFVAAGVALWLSGNKRLIDRLKTAGLVLVALGVLLAAVSYFVETDIEKVTRLSHELVKSAVDQDWKKMESLLGATVGVKFATLTRSYEGRDGVLAGAKTGVTEVGLQSATVAGLEATRAGPILTTRFRVFTEQNKIIVNTIPSDWEMDWRDTGQGWQVTEIRCVAIGNQGGADAKSQLPK